MLSSIMVTRSHTLSSVGKLTWYPASLIHASSTTRELPNEKNVDVLPIDRSFGVSGSIDKPCPLPDASDVLPMLADLWIGGIDI